MVEVLLANGAKLDPRDRNGETPLHWAAYKGHARVARLLISRGANINAKISLKKHLCILPIR